MIDFTHEMTTPIDIPQKVQEEGDKNV